MPKLKPPWVITDIPKTTKVKLWRLMKDNPTYKSWEKAIVGKSYTTDPDKIFTDAELAFIKMSKDTYNSLKKEVMLMPLKEVDTLPIDLQRWILELRPDLKKEQTKQGKKKAMVTTSGEPYEDTPQKKAEETSQADDPLKRHFAELSETALTLAANLEEFLNYQGTNFKSEIGDIVYGGPMEVDVEYTGLTRYVRMAIFPQFLALDLLSHIRDEFPDLAKINDWAELTSNELTYDLIARLGRTAKKGTYRGKCKDCSS